MTFSNTLYLVATPIGNLKDITLRALEILKSVDFIICEDTRRSGMLLSHFEIKKPLRVLNDHTREGKLEALLRELESVQSAALISDAGTPLISDPGFPLVREAIKRGIKIESIPGPVAFVNALIMSNLPANEFTFVGYLAPKQKKRCDQLAALKEECRTLVFYESPHRLLRMLEDALSVLGDREAFVAREMTKKFEETFRGKISEILKQFESRKILGEFVIVVAAS